MIKKVPFRIAVNTVLLLEGGILVFHLLVVARIIPYAIVWGGRLKNVEQMLRFEMVSLALNLLLVLIVAIKADYIRRFISLRIVTITLWFYMILFSLNTIGNLFAEKNLETIIFTPATFVLAVLIYRIALERPYQ